MNPILVFAICAVILIFIILYRSNTGEDTYKFVSAQSRKLYSKIAPFTYKEIRKKIRDLKQDYTVQQYIGQVVIFAAGGGVITYLYFYNLIISIIYIIVAVSFIPYITYLRCKRQYSEFIFEQIQTYTSNTIMEFSTMTCYMA